MADVQLEHGHMRVANTLDEALTLAPFTGTQQKILRCLMRLTYGWKQHSVSMSRPDIAERCGVPAVGGFLRAFDELMRQGVVVEVSAPFGRQPGAYAINKDFESWGAFSVAAARLEALFRKRPPAGGRPTREGQSSNEVSQTPEGGSSEARPTLEGQGDRPSRVGDGDPIGSVKRPEVADNQEVRPSESNRKKEKEIQQQQLARAREDSAAAAGDVTDPDRQATAAYAGDLVKAVNRAAIAKWPGSFSPYPVNQAALTLAAQLRGQSIDVALAARAVSITCTGSKLLTPPATVSYFRGSIVDAHAYAEHERRKHAGDTDAARGGDPKALDELLSIERIKRHKELEARHNLERRAAGIAWGKDPANATEYGMIVLAANAAVAGFLDSKFGQTARDKDVIIRSAAAAGFPEFDAWVEQQPADDAIDHPEHQEAS